MEASNAASDDANDVASNLTSDVAGNVAKDAAERAARRSYGKLIAFLCARTRDLASAEDALSAAFESALRDWPSSGVPTNPEAWLLTAARRSMIDASRRRKTRDEAVPDLLLFADVSIDADDRRAIPDDRLLMMFACAHPAIEAGVRAPLMLQAILGFDAATIASAFLVAPRTMGQRLVRAKAKIKQAGIPFRLPEHEDLAERLGTVLEAVYAAFSEGWSDPAGTEARRRNLAEEGIWLGELLAVLMPDQPEVLGLLALMLHAQARRGARRDAQGRYVPLAEQDPSLWDSESIDRAESLLLLASRSGVIGRYQLEAAVQSAHVVRRRTGNADWAAIAQLYDALYALTGSPVVGINRAVAIGETRGPAEGLAALDALADDARLAEYQPYWAARAGLLARSTAAGSKADGDAAFARAIGLESDPAVREFLQRRREECVSADRTGRPASAARIPRGP